MDKTLFTLDVWDHILGVLNFILHKKKFCIPHFCVKTHASEAISSQIMNLMIFKTFVFEGKTLSPKGRFFFALLMFLKKDCLQEDMFLVKMVCLFIGQNNHVSNYFRNNEFVNLFSNT